MTTGFYGIGVGLEPLPYDLWLDGGNGGRNGQMALEIKTGRSGQLTLAEATTWLDADSLRGMVSGPQPCALAILDPWQLYLRLPNAFRSMATEPVPYQATETHADYIFASEASLAAFIDTTRLPLPTLRHDDLVLVVSSWLSFLMSAPADQLAQRPADAWVVATGLHQVIAGGTVQENDLRKAYGGHPVR